EKAAKQAELDKAKADADKAIDAATDKAGVDTALADGKATIGAIDTTASAEKAAAKKDLEEAYNAKKDAIINSGLTAEEKAAKQVELDKAKADADKAIDAATTDADVDTALNKGKADIAAIDPSASAEKAAAKKKSVLPNTGDNIGLSSILGVSGLALLGIAIRKKREN
ncbi:TPA: LPXTG cell wall anchor domain-containing protein, partial [Streptococcus suis]